MSQASVKRELWVNLCPRKLLWELSYSFTAGKGAQLEWWKYPQFLAATFTMLSQAGISGLRLNVFPFELIEQPNEVKWERLELVLNLAHAANIQIDWCLGPFQYPLWPGVRVPFFLQDEALPPILDENTRLAEFGIWWLETQLQRLGRDSRISGFYLGNEWPTEQAVEGRTEKIVGISGTAMDEYCRLCNRMTKKPIIFNTNFDATQLPEILSTYTRLFSLLPEQAVLGLDVYPSRERWSIAPQLLVRRILKPYPQAVADLREKIKIPLIFSEFEAQPWGKGEAWSDWIDQLTDNNEYFPMTLLESFQDYIVPSKIAKVTLWGAEFWCVAAQKGIRWPLQNITEIATL